MELPGAEVARPRSVILGQGGEHDRTDRHVDPDAEGVGATNDLQESFLGEQLHQPAVLREHAGVVDADAVPDQAGQGPAEPGGEPESADRLGDGVLLRTAAHVDAHQRLGAFQRRRLGEVDDVDRCLVGAQQLFQRLVQRSGHVAVEQRYRALRGPDDGGRPAGPASQILLEAADVTEGGRHEDELRVRELEQRHLPRPAAVGIGVEVELVHHDLPHLGGRCVPQGDVGQDLGGAADDGGGLVDAGVPGHHPHTPRAERGAQGEELLRHQRLDGRGVEAAPAVGHRGEVGAGGHEALAGPGRGGHDDVGSGHHLDERLELGGVQGQTLSLRPRGERVEDAVGIGVRGQLVGERHDRSDRA